MDAKCLMNFELYAAVERKLRTSAGVVGGLISDSALMCFFCADTPFALNVCP